MSDDVGRVKRLSDEMAGKYDAAFADARSLAEHLQIFRWLQPLVPPSGQVLDLGCGTGRALEYLGLPPWKYTGIDLSPQMLALARKKFPSYTFLEGDLQDLAQMLSGRYSLVLCLFALDFAPDLHRALDEICRLLRPGGQLALLVAGTRWPKVPSNLPQWGEARALMTFLSAGTTQIVLMGHGLTTIRRTSFHGPLFSALPSRMRPTLASRVVQLEARTLGALAPESCLYHLFTARKALRKEGSCHAAPTARIERV